MKVIRLEGLEWSKKLYELMCKYDESFKHLKDRYRYLTDELVIACVDDDEKIVQVMLSKLDDSTSTTIGIYGDFGDHTIEMLNCLCAYCSSQNVPIEDQFFTIENEKKLSEFLEFFNLSRLGSYTAMTVTDLPSFYAKIRYPVY